MLLLQKREDQRAAASDWVCPLHVGLTDEVFHDDVALTLVAAADKHEDVADAEEAARVEDATCLTLSPLVFACGAGLGLVLSNGAAAEGRGCRRLTVRIGIGWTGGVRGIHDQRYLRFPEDCLRS